MKTIFLLDMDDTLLDFQRAERENFLHVMQLSGFPADESMANRFHEINDSLWKALERGKIDRETLKVFRFELLFEEYKLHGDASAVAYRYWSHFPSVCYPFPGSAFFLKALKQRGRIYIVTNGGRQIQMRHIELAGFTPYLNGVFISEEIGANKPSSAFADYIEAHIHQYCRKETVWIGDSLSSDGACAQTREIDFLRFYPKKNSEIQYRELLFKIDAFS